MWLIQVNDWCGASRHRPKTLAPMVAIENQKAYVSRLPLPDALLKLAEYEGEYARVYGDVLEVNLTVLGIQEIPHLDDDVLSDVRLPLIEAVVKTLQAERGWAEKN